MIKNKINEIEMKLKAMLIPDIIKYIRIKDNKIILIPPGKEGWRVILDFIFEDKYNVIDFDFEKISAEYEGFEIIDVTEDFENTKKEIEKLFK